MPVDPLNFELGVYVWSWLGLLGCLGISSWLFYSFEVDFGEIMPSNKFIGGSNT